MARLYSLLLAGCLSLLLASAGRAQAPAVEAHPARTASDGTICPSLTGPSLTACLRAGYSRTTVVAYDLARDYLYGRNGQVGFYTAPYTGVYSGRSGPLGGGASPTQIDTEHTWPRAEMPASGLQEGDMHNLFPTISKVNNDRGNLPFGDVSDAQTSGWYGPTGALPQLIPPPESERPLFSKRLTNVRFETRADHKGNVARTLAYFYSLYGSASASFWTAQRPYLLAWHRSDLPDSLERARSAFIRQKQGNDNPFVLDTSLVRRLIAAPVAAEPEPVQALDVSLRPSHTRTQATLRGTVPGPTSVTVSVFDALGRRVLLVPAGTQDGAFDVVLDVSALVPGVYYAHVRATGAVAYAQTFSLVRLP